MDQAPKVTGGAEDVAMMNHLQGEIEKAILPYRDRVEAIAVVGALLRVARILLRLYKPELRADFMRASIAYLRGQQSFDGDDVQSPLQALGFWVPPGSSN